MELMSVLGLQLAELVLIGVEKAITTNVMCTCDHDMRFTYVHLGWEGRANDLRVLEEAIKNPKHGFPWPLEGMHVLNLNTK